MGDPQPVDLGLPEKLAPYESTLAIHYAKTEVVSFEFNPRNLESPAYALHALASFDLLHDTRLCEPAGCVQAAQDQEDRAHKQPPQTEPARATRSAGVKKESGRVKQDTTPRLRTRPGLAAKGGAEGDETEVDEADQAVSDTASIRTKRIVSLSREYRTWSGHNLS
ncbi:hypothetical protein BD626DRAFT_572120 [Schizophyllum amplum]|uniref:Uncharacterized protein n=1 Tax=Schizophyllum amplum TaxID=97359 RepID=A0A550C5M9_9AGAR|nr:hypothetical protein BD626DRAFT_572120 [Auriculariopsis ampla]